MPALAALVASAAVSAAAAPPSPGVIDRSGDGERPERAALAGADRFVDGRPAAIKASSGDRFMAGDVISSSGLQYVPYERTHRGLPVVGGDFVVVTDATGQVRTTSSALESELAGVDTTPSVPADRARVVASQRLGQVDRVGEPTLVVHALDTARLAWQVEVTGKAKGAPSRQTVYVDARTGKRIGAVEHVLAGDGQAAYSGPNPVHLDTSFDGRQYSMKDPGRDLVCQDSKRKKTFTGTDDLWGNGDATNKETGCVDGLFAAQLEWRMLHDWLGRDGMDGNGGAWPLRVGLNAVNAYYNGQQVQIGHNTRGQWISSIDVVAHEFGHGIDDTTPGGISGGGTQEFIADVFGALTEAYSNQGAEYDAPDYLVGEEIDLVGRGPIRNMYNPSLVEGDPNCWSPNIPNTEVHAAAGPGNHWFYLLAEGSNPGGGKPQSPTCNNSTVTGIGIQDAAKILYNAMLMKTSASDYPHYRTWTLTAAKNLYPGSCTEFDTVKAAWDAVSVPAQAGEPTCGGGSSTPSPGQSVDFTGLAKLSNCSASVVRYADSQPGDPVLALTNGHCYEGGMPSPGQVLVDRRSRRAFTLLGTSGEPIGTERARRLLYATMTGTDLALYQLGTTYAELVDDHPGFTPLTLAEKGPVDGTPIAVVSGYWQKIYTCSVDSTVYQLREAGWTFEQSIKYSRPGCETIPGTSGSPIVAGDTGEQVGINNTGNEDGERCTLNNPCEVDESGNVTVDHGASYGQQTWWLYTCLTPRNTLDLTLEGCQLPAPPTAG